MNNKVLVIGSSNVDMTLYVDKFPKEKETKIGKQLLYSFGGKGLNQSYALNKANVDVTLAYAIGDDANGENIKGFIINSGIKGIDFKYQNVNSGHATIIVDDSSENEIIVIPGANHSMSIDDIKTIERSFKEFSYIVIQNELRLDVTEYIIKTASKYNVKIFYNPAPYLNIDEELYKYIEVFTPNEIELSSYSDVDVSDLDSLIKGCKTLINKGIKNVVVTLGSHGSFHMNKDGYKLYPAIKIKAVDTVSAGDTFSAYLLYGLLNDYSYEEAIKLATKASAITCMNKGSLRSIPSLKKVLETEF